MTRAQLIREIKRIEASYEAAKSVGSEESVLPQLLELLPEIKEKLRAAPLEPEVG